MEDYKKLLLLKYIDLKLNVNGFENFINYSGILHENLYEYIEELVSLNLIEYSEHNININKTGRAYLVNKGLEKFSFSNSNDLNNILIGECMNIDEIYIPKRFTKKV